MKLKIAYSTCPNDTFIFGALAQGLIETKGIIFEPYLCDLQELNQLARKVEFDVIKVSAAAYLLLKQYYTLLQTGGAVGRGCGPLLVAKKKIEYEDIPLANIAIPAIDSTAHLLLNYFCPYIRSKPVMTFNEIIPAILDNQVDAGVIIHESRFVYQEKGLVLIQDLGENWENITGLPIPLGVILASNKIPQTQIPIINQLIYKSIQYAYSHPEEIFPYIQKHSQEMEVEVIAAHINLYVNEFSLNLGKEGNKALDKMEEVAQRHLL